MVTRIATDITIAVVITIVEAIRVAVGTIIAVVITMVDIIIVVVITKEVIVSARQIMIQMQSIQ